MVNCDGQRKADGYCPVAAAGDGSALWPLAHDDLRSLVLMSAVGEFA